jgi:RecA/RadA recombinase
MRDLNKNLGKDSVNFADTMEVRERIPFKQKCITNFTGGGVVRGLHACFWGSKSCGKSTVVLDLIAKAQELGCICVYINGEQSYDPIYAAKRGVDTKTLVVENVKKLEDGLDTVIRLCKENVVDLIVFDSIHGLAPKAELVAGKGEKDKSTSDSNMALRARALTQYFEMGVAEVSKAKCAVVLIAQSRMDLGSFVKIETLTGGHALLHNCRLIIRFRRGQGADAPTEKRPTGDKDVKGKEKMKDVAIGFDLVMHVNKSQIEGCTEGDEIHVPFYFAEGIKE